MKGGTGALLLTVLLAGCSAERPPVEGPKLVAADAGFMATDAGDAQNSGAGDAKPDASMLDTGAASADQGLLVPVEARGLWVTRWDYKSADDVRTILDDAVAAGVNQVYFQVRGEADAFYQSSLEPWGLPLTGTLGKDPGWDPLAVAVEEAHRHSIELHAWVNVASAWKSEFPPQKSSPSHLLRLHPDWGVVDRAGRVMPYSENSYVFVNLAHPEVQKHLLAVLAELVKNYAVDGLHLDYCRYPASDTSFDRVSNKLFAAAKKEEPDLDRAAWQRRELTRFVKAIRDEVKAIRPALVLSAAVTGIYQDRWSWGQVQRGFDDFHQDSHTWAEEGAVDVLVPMIYWPPSDPPGGFTDFATLVQDFAPLKGKVKLLAGINVEAGGPPVMARELKLARAAGFSGAVLFSWAGLKKHGWFANVREKVFPAPEGSSGGCR